MDNSIAYETARATHTAALSAYDAALVAYRAGNMTDADFLAARAVKVDADRAFDVAFAAESEREEAPAIEAPNPQLVLV